MTENNDSVEDSVKEIEDRVKQLKGIERFGGKYLAFSCDRVGALNNELIAINKAGWSLHRVIPIILPEHLTTSKMSYFCIIAEKLGD